MKLGNLITILIAVIAGVLIGNTGISIFWSLLPLGIGCILIAVSSFLRREMRLEEYRMLNLLAGTSLFLGVGMFSMSFTKPSEPEVSRMVYTYIGEIQSVDPTTSGDRMLVKFHTLENQRGEKIAGDIKAIITTEDVSSFRVGDIIEGKTELRHVEMKGNYLNPDYVSYLKNKSIYLRGYAKEGEIRKSGESYSVKSWGYRMRERLETAIEKTSLSAQTKGFLISVVLGDRSYMTPESKSLFTNAGIAHLFAVSGMHVGMIAGIILVLISLLFWRGNFKWAYGISIPIVWVYVVITGLSPSTIRAASMLTIFFMSVILERRYQPLKALIWTVILMLCLMPGSLFDIGFQLSVVCVASLILLVKPLTFVEASRHKILSRVVSVIMISIIATFTTWVIVSFYFSTISLSFLPANFIAVPLLPVYIGLALIYLFLFAFGLDFSLLGRLLDNAYELFLRFIETVERNGHVIENFSVGWPTVALWFVLIIFAAYMLNSGKKRTKPQTAALCIMFLAAIVTIPLFRQVDSTKGFIIQNNYSDISLMHYNEGKEKQMALPRSSVAVMEVGDKKIVSLDCDPADAGALNDADFIIVGGGFKGEFKDLLRYAGAGKVVVHSSMRKKREAELVKACREGGVPVHSLREEGPLHCFE